MPSQADPAQVRARQLVAASGSPQLAKQAIDRAGHKAAAAGAAAADKDAFARGLGFESFLAMFEATTPATARDGAPWLVTALPDGQWMVWSEAHLRAYRKFATREAAMEFIQSGVNSLGT